MHGSRAMDASAHFLARAKHYRLAAAMTENPLEIERLCDVASMFEQMAHDVRRLRQERPRFSADGYRAQSPHGAVGMTRFATIWHTLAEFIRLSARR
jgi:hypothetical protein